MAFPKSRILSTEKLVQLIAESSHNGERFCFILGSGASVESGIPSGNTLEKRWMDCIMGEKNDIYTPPMDADYMRQKASELYEEKLIQHNFKDIEAAWKKSKEPGNSIPSTYYFDIYKLRFYPSQSNGYRYLEHIMDNCEPSLGYHTLAKLLTENNHNNLVITTNFDSLVEDALFLYTAKKPLVVSHESLAGYIESDIQRPIVAKVHRGLMYAPFNTPEKTDRLQPEWRDALNYAFNTYTPIVIGYGGGDHSLMSFLEEKTTFMRKGVYWCYREASGLPEENIQNFIKEKNGYFVSIGGFDALMMKIGTALYKDCISPVDTEALLKSQCNKRVGKYNEQWNELEKKPEMQPVLQPINEAEQIAEKEREKENKLTSWDHIRRGNRAYDFGDLEKAIAEFNTAIKINPYNPMTYVRLGFVNGDLGLHNIAIENYNKAIELDQKDANAYNNRAFEYNSLGLHDKAIEDCNSAIKLNPIFPNPFHHRGNAYHALGNYQKAIQDFSIAISLNPKYKDAYLNRAKAYRAIGEDALADADEKFAKKL